VKFTRREIALLMRSMLRSLEHTPLRETDLHKALYEKLTSEFVRRTPKKLLKDVGAAIDHAIGR
jgi:hypothetical protein